MTPVPPAVSLAADAYTARPGQVPAFDRHGLAADPDQQQQQEQEGEGE